MSARTYVEAFFASALLFGALALPVQSQAGGSGWTPFVGCWQPLDAGGEAGLLCFRPAGDGVEMFNVVGGQVASTERLAADGTPRPVTAEGCTGFESASFSADGQRVFTRSEFSCGDEIRAGSGVMSFIGLGQWVDVRSLEVEGEPVAWVRRYQIADPEDLAEQGVDDPAVFDRTLVRAMRARAARDIDVDDVEEAAMRIEARAVEVWVATHETELELSGDRLLRLADAGVPESVIDVMVAVSYPERFMVSPEGAAAAAEMSRDGGYATGYRRGFRSYLWDPYYRPIGFGYGYGYSPFGYYGYGVGGYYGGYYGYRPAPIIVQPAPSGSRGRMVPGRGYTRGSSSAGSSGGAGPRSGVGGAAPAPSRGGNDSGSSGASSGGSRGSSGRTAQPRRGN